MESIQLLSNWAGEHPIFIALTIAWTLVWKGFALWRSAELRQKYWFIAILLINTLGILEIIYLFLVVKNYKVAVVEKSEESKQIGGFAYWYGTGLESRRVQALRGSTPLPSASWEMKSLARPPRLR